VAETSQPVLPQRPGVGSSFVTSRQRVSKATTPARPVERCGFVAMPTAPERTLRGSFLFPFWDMAGVGWIVLMSMALTPFSIAVSALGNLVARGGPFALGVMGLLALALVFMFGYAVAFLNNVIAAAAEGELVHPRWPDFDAYAMLGAYLPWLVGVVVGSPLILPAFLSATARGTGAWAGRMIFASLLLLPAGFVMMAALTAILHGSLAAARPLVVLKAILRIGGSYLKIWIFGGSVIALGVLTYWLLNDCPIIPVTLIGSWLAWIVFLYAAMVAARALGVAYYRDAVKIGWFPERQRWGVRG
jgi:hypothetical protein